MKQFSTIIILFALAACTPKLQQPTIVTPERYIYSSTADSVALTHNWWEMFGDTTLNRLITTALAANNDLKSAASRIEEARASVRASRAQYLPSFTLGRSAGVTGGEKTVQQYIVEPAVSWEIPLFGSLRDVSVDAKAGIGYAEWQYRGIELSLAAEVATAYYTLLQYQRDLNIARESSRLREQTATLVDSLYVRGMATGVNREQAYNLLYTSLADIPLYERAVNQTLLQLDLLLGQNPSLTADITVHSPFVSDYTPVEIPAGVPSDLLYRRPDVMSCYMETVSATAKARLARVARFPTFTLTADGGVVSDQIGKLFAKSSWVWGALLSLTQPIYNFGGLKSAERVAVEQYNQALYNYRQSFLSALSDVESALVSIATYRDEIARYKELIRTTTRVAELTSALYENGLTAYLDVIDAERTLYNSQLQYSNLIAGQYINYINLCKALGGGWNSEIKF